MRRVVVLACAPALLMAGMIAACSPAGDKPAGAKTEAATPGAGGDLIPRPKIGKWNMTMDIAGMPQKQSVAVCLTQEMIDDMKGYAQSSGQTSCTSNETRREGAAVVTRAVCDSHGTKSIIVTRAEGDFNSRYTVVTSIKSDPPGASGEMTSSTLAEYLGPC